MTRSRAEELLVESWERPLSAAERTELEGLLRQQPDLNADARLWDALEALEEAVPVPSERLRERFYEALAEAQREQARPEEDSASWWWTQSASLRMAASVGLIVFGTVLGVVVTGWMSARGEAARLRDELASVQERVIVALLEHPVASERLRGASWSGTVRLDGRTLDALVATAEADESVNVRMAALDALEGHVHQGNVRERLADSLRSTPSPIVQLRLVELLFGDGRGADLAVEPLLAPGVLDEVVRERLIEMTRSAGGRRKGETV